MVPPPPTIPHALRSRNATVRFVVMQVEVTEREDGVIELRPQVPVPASQAWFWTDAWQKRERQADEDVAAGRVTSYDDGESFLASLSD